MARQKIRYAVVGLGWIAQETILPAFARAKDNSQLAALVSDDPVKLKELGDKYNVPQAARFAYKDYDVCLNSGLIDAVFIALPNSLHEEYTVRAAQAKVHVLCEKPMAINESECWSMMKAAQKNNVKLMIAYRLHFEEGNLKAIEIAKSGKLGEVRIFNSIFCMPVKEGNVRLDGELTGGSLYDIGIYCINAARSIFAQEPVSVTAFTNYGKDKRFAEVDEMTSVIMRFPNDQLASFTCSFNAFNTSTFTIIGTKGSLTVDPAYHHSGEVKHQLKIKAKTAKETFGSRQQFAAELVYFSDCILKDKDPEPSGLEGLADVRVIEAIYESAKSGRPVKVERIKKDKRPHLGQSIKRRDSAKPKMVHAERPSAS
jgi:predicted dehydrogenase